MISKPGNSDFALSPADGTPAAKPRRNAKVRSPWYLVSNQLNLMYLLAAGLISGPRGFAGKYYQDPLALMPGWIPLFAGNIPATALAQSVSEGAPLRAVIAELDLAAMRGPVTAMDADGQLRTVDYPDGLDGREAVLLVPAPLPTAWIKTVFFQSASDKTATLDEVGDFANVLLPASMAKVKVGLFKPGPRSTPVTWPPPVATTGQAVSPRDPALHRVWAVGATMTLLAAIANRGDVAVAACRLAFDPRMTAPESLDNPVLLALQRWSSVSPPADSDGRQTRMLLDSLQVIIDEKQAADREGRGADTRQAILDYLQRQKTRLEDPRQRDALDKLERDLTGILGFGGDTGGELLQRHAKPWPRALVLFFLRQDCQGLLEFEHPLLNEMDSIVAAMLFAAATGWRSLPNPLRLLAGIDAVSQRMASSAQQSAGTGLDLGLAPAWRRPLRDLLTPGAKGWTRKQQKMALALARGMGWKDIVHTRISLGKGDYQLQINAGGAHILLDGEVKAVTTQVEIEPLLQRLGDTVLTAKLEATVRKQAG